MSQSSSMDIRATLADYDLKNRALDTFGIVVFFLFEGYLLWKMLPFIAEHPFIVALICVLGYLMADFVSGFVHWLGDTWGSVSTPVIGKLFIRTFREHHVDQAAITHHGFTETNGSNCLASAVLLLPVMIAVMTVASSNVLSVFVLFVWATALGLFATNQFHKWAHRSSRPAVITWLQRHRLILSPEHHAIHHASPYDRYYCITVGWMNPILARLKFFPRLEVILSRLTGAMPRENDHTLTKAQ